MRTTLTIDDKIAQTLKEIAYQTGRSYKEVVNETLRSGIAAKKAATQRSKHYKLKAKSLGKVSGHIDMTKALQVADQLEDEEIARKLDMRK